MQGGFSSPLLQRAVGEIVVARRRQNTDTRDKTHDATICKLVEEILRNGGGVGGGGAVFMGVWHLYTWASLCTRRFSFPVLFFPVHRLPFFRWSLIWVGDELLQGGWVVKGVWFMEGSGVGNEL